MECWLDIVMYVHEMHVAVVWIDGFTLGYVGKRQR
jgi:hypothetical protein